MVCGLADLYRKWEADAEHYLVFADGVLPFAEELPHLFAVLSTAASFREHLPIYPRSLAAGGRIFAAAVWESIFTCDLRRYRRAPYNRMSDFTTLITGPSGTGKEL